MLNNSLHITDGGWSQDECHTPDLGLRTIVTSTQKVNGSSFSLIPQTDPVHTQPSPLCVTINRFTSPPCLCVCYIPAQDTHINAVSDAMQSLRNPPYNRH